MSAHEPTRMCPHPLCRPLHGISAIGGLAFIAAAAIDKPYLLLIFAVSALLAAAVYRIVHKQTMGDTVREAVDGKVHFEVQRRWANAAATADGILATGIVTCFAIACLTWQGGDSAPASRTTIIAALLAGAALTAVSETLHRKAIKVVAPS